MALKSGDNVPEDGCNRVGNIPFALLKNPNELEAKYTFSDASFQIADSAKKQDYIDFFEFDDLIVCEDNEPFAKQGQPYFLSLNKKEDAPDPDPEDPDEKYIFRISIGFKYCENEVGPGGWGNATLKNAQLFYVWNSDEGNNTKDITEGNPVPSCTFSGPLTHEAFCEPEVTGSIVIENLWNPNTMNPEFIHENQLNDDLIIAAKVIITFNGGNVNFTHIEELTGTGSFVDSASSNIPGVDKTIQVFYPGFICKQPPNAPSFFAKSGSLAVNIGSALYLRTV